MLQTIVCLLLLVIQLSGLLKLDINVVPVVEMISFMIFSPGLPRSGLAVEPWLEDR